MTENNPYRKHYAHYPEGVDINCSNCAGAYDEGIKLVVEFLGEEPFEHNYHRQTFEHLEDDCFACKWEAQKKEWLNEKV